MPNHKLCQTINYAKAYIIQKRKYAISLLSQYINYSKRIINPRHKFCQNINCTKELIMPKSYFCQSINYAKAYIIQKRKYAISLLWQDTNYSKGIINPRR
jgi:hypothetical protein